MSLFHYRAINAAGEAVSGELEAASLGAVERNLRGRGVWLREATARTSPSPRASGRGVGRGELIGFFVEMSLLLRARISLPTTLERMAEDFAGERLGPIVRRLYEDVNSGVALHQAMAAQPRVFSAQVVAMVQAGEVSGRLPEVFESLTTYLQWLDQLVSDIRQALIYPLIVTTATLGLIVGLFTLVVPRFIELLQGQSMATPWLTQVVMAVSNFLVRGWPVLVALAVGLPVLLKLARRSPAFAAGCDRLLMRLPVFGSLIAMFGLSRFTHNLGMLYRAGIPLLRGLEICRHLVGNRAIARALDEVRQGVAEGAPLSRCLGRHDFFPATLVTMIASGETSGSLDFSLQSVADYYDKIIPRRIKLIFAIVNPAIMLVLIGVVGSVALAVVLPILQLWQAR
jgi:type II secretory pathway component PulF